MTRAWRFDPELGAEGRLLVLALKAQLSGAEGEAFVGLVRRLGAEEALAAGRHNSSELPVLRRLVELLPPPEVLPPWRTRLEQNQARVEELIDALRAVVVDLEAAGIASACLEGGGVLLGSELPLAVYGSGDLDLLVDGGRFDDVRACFERAGFRARDRRGRPTSRVEFGREGRHGALWLEVGPEPFDRMWVPLEVGSRQGEWLARRVPSRVEGLWVLAPSDLLLQVAMHTSLHGFVRAPGLRLHVDVDRVVRDTPVDWASFLAEAETFGGRTRVFVSLAMAAGLLDTPIPEHVLAQLAPGVLRWQALSRLLRGACVRDGGTTLGRAQTIVLDSLLDDAGVGHWLRSVALPDADWMRSHFARGEACPPPVWRLHAKRGAALLTRWRPR